MGCACLSRTSVHFSCRQLGLHLLSGFCPTLYDSVLTPICDTVIPSNVLRAILDEVVEMVNSSTKPPIHSLLSVDCSTTSTSTPSVVIFPLESLVGAEPHLPKRATKGNEKASQTQRLPLHLSLSRPLLLQTAQREALRTAVRKVANDSKGFEGSYAEFSVLENDEATRRFLSIEIGFGFAQVCPLRSLVSTLRTTRDRKS